MNDEVKEKIEPKAYMRFSISKDAWWIVHYAVEIPDIRLNDQEPSKPVAPYAKGSVFYSGDTFISTDKKDVAKLARFAIDNLIDMRTRNVESQDWLDILKMAMEEEPSKS